MKEKFMYDKLINKKTIFLSAVLFCMIAINSSAFAQGLFDDDFLGSSVPEVSPVEENSEVAPLPAISTKTGSSENDDTQKTNNLPAPPKAKNTPPPPPLVGKKEEKKARPPKIKTNFPSPATSDKKANQALPKKGLPLPPKSSSSSQSKEQTKESQPKIEVPKVNDDFASFLPQEEEEKKETNKNEQDKENMVFSSLQNISSKRPSQSLLGKVSTELFRQMADIERQNALLALQLKRESLRSEIEAIKRQRRLALQEEISKKEEARRKQLEWEHEQEQEKIEAEKKMQEEKNKMLISQLTEKLEETETRLTSELKELKQEKQEQAQKLKEEKEKAVKSLKAELEKLKEENARTKKNANSKIIALAEAAKKKGQKLAQAAKRTTEIQKKQIEELKRKLNARINEINLLNKKNLELVEIKETVDESEDTPEVEEFSDENILNMQVVSSYDENQTPAEELYAVLEVRGSRDDVVAKLLTKDGFTFLVKKGTLLSSGHKVVDIKKNHIKVSKNGRLEIIGFPAGGVMDREPTLQSVLSKKVIGDAPTSSSTPDWEKDKEEETKEEEDSGPPPPPTIIGNPSSVSVSGRPRMPGMR